MISRRKAAFTAMELLIAVSIMTILMAVVYRLQTSSSRVYMISAWKQEHTRQLQYLIKILKEDLGEASKRVRSVAGSAVPVIEDSPLSYNSNGVGPQLLEFTRNHFNNNGDIEYQIHCELTMNGRNIEYTRRVIDGAAPEFKLVPSQINLNDVDRVEIEARPIVYSKKTGYEYTLEGAIDASDEEVSGALLNVSFILSPPGNVVINKPLIESFQKKIFVSAQLY
jgi:prepilin-type N-terminal cleavage/methylation domain-containing protein